MRHTVGSGEIARGGGPVTLEGLVQHFIGVVLGAAASYLLLVIMVGGQYADKYLPAVIVGGIVAMLWPWVIGMILVRRARGRQDERMHKQVEKEMAERDAAAKR